MASKQEVLEIIKEEIFNLFICTFGYAEVEDKMRARALLFVQTGIEEALEGPLFWHGFRGTIDLNSAQVLAVLGKKGIIKKLIEYRRMYEEA